MNIIITGASRGIGNETAKILALDPTNSILVISRSEKELKRLSEASINSNIRYLASDIITLSKRPETVVKEITAFFSRVDILINNAGVLIPKPFKDLSESENDLVIETNFTAPLRLIRVILPLMHSGSHVINIGSMGGVQGSSKYPGLSVYSAAKAALAVLTESLASEYNESGIHFNCLSFGAVQTEMFESAFPGYNAPITANGMAEFVAWFAQNGNKFFNGKILPVSVSNP